MEAIIFYLVIFCIGTLFGSFFTLAVHRIPLHQDITHKRSYCPNCNYKLGFIDMIPILSYIFLGGKCRYCKQKIRLRYLFLEIFSGLIFLLFAISLNINFNLLQINKFVYLIFGILYLTGLIIIAGIDKEKKEISKPLILFEIVIVSTYMIYLYIVENTNIYRYVIYLFGICILLIFNYRYIRKNLKDNYTMLIIILSIIISMFSGEIAFIVTVMLVLASIVFEYILNKIKDRKNKISKKDISYYNNLPIGFYLCCINIIVVIFFNILACR